MYQIRVVIMLHMQLCCDCAEKVVVLYRSPLDVCTIIVEYSWSTNHPCCCCLDNAFLLYEGMH